MLFSITIFLPFVAYLCVVVRGFRSVANALLFTAWITYTDICNSAEIWFLSLQMQVEVPQLAASFHFIYIPLLHSHCECKLMKLSP